MIWELLLSVAFLGLPQVTLTDLLGFPSQEVVDQELVWNQGCINHARQSQLLNPHQSDSYDLYIADMERRRGVWCTLNRAHNELANRCFGRALLHLDELRYMLGPADYAAKQMPSVIPYEYFSER